MNIANDSESRFPQNHSGFDYRNGRSGGIWAYPINTSWSPSNFSNTSYSPFSVNSISTTFQPNKQCKRKAESTSPVATKQHITEEKMAAHMSRLHISSESTSYEEKEMTKERRLYMCEEMRKLQTESIIPAALISRIERPSMAVVLWQPPSPLVNLTPRNIESENNNNSEQDFNRMEFDAI